MTETRTYCDRCGMEITESKEQNSKITIESLMVGIREYDLCLMCAYKLKNFMRILTEEETENDQD